MISRRSFCRRNGRSQQAKWIAGLRKKAYIKYY